MKSKKKLIAQNNAAINDFISWYKGRTAKEMSDFLFELQGMYFTQPGISLSKEGASEAVIRFDLLYRLVNDLQPLKKES